VAAPEVFWYGMVWYTMVYWYTMVWYCMVWCTLVWYGMVWYGMVWYGMVWYGMVWYGMVWYGLVWYGVPLPLWLKLLTLEEVVQEDNSIDFFRPDKVLFVDPLSIPYLLFVCPSSALGDR
jgi:hypothetical protein